MARAVKKPRLRRDATTAREAILDAAERRLVDTGPGGIRLQEVAADAGVSHPTVLHHFGSREALVKAVCSRSLQAIHLGLVEAISASSGEDDQLVAMLNSVYEALTKTGHARVMMWLALEGQRLEGADVRLDTVIDATHELRKKRAGRKRLAREDTANAVVLAALALTGSAVIGPAIFENAGLGSDEETGKRFRRWLARLLATHLDVAEP